MADVKKPGNPAFLCLVVVNFKQHHRFERPDWIAFPSPATAQRCRFVLLNVLPVKSAYSCMVKGVGLGSVQDTQLQAITYQQGGIVR
jgi:hypothetical protein